MKYEKVILVTPESAEEQAQFEAQYPNLQFFAFRGLKTFVIPSEDEAPVKSEPIESEPIESEPIESEPIESEPIESEPIESKATDSNTFVRNYAAAVGALNDYYGIEVPDSVLVSAINKNPVFKKVVDTGRFGDPVRREALVNALLRELGLPPWPSRGAQPRDLQNFKINLSMKLAKVGGKLKYQTM